jgi:hypothetical protein
MILIFANSGLTGNVRTRIYTYDRIKKYLLLLVFICLCLNTAQEQYSKKVVSLNVIEATLLLLFHFNNFSNISGNNFRANLINT